jgi:polyhydroxyalkanoate synthesis repressor PhaR
VTQETVLIRKYENRRLYDTSASRYVNLDDIAQMVREGKDVRIIDARTGEDLTRVILTQIITEDARDQPAGLPLELLRQLIMASDKAGREFVMWYLTSAFDTYHKVKDAVQNRISEVQASAMSPLQMMSNLMPGSSMWAGAAQEKPSAEVDELRRRIAELEARLNQQSKTRKKSVRPSKSPKKK